MTLHSLDDNYIVFRGQEQEASSAHLRGKLILCIGEPITMKHVKLTLTGMSRLSYACLNPRDIVTGHLTDWRLQMACSIHHRNWRIETGLARATVAGEDMGIQGGA